MYRSLVALLLLFSTSLSAATLTGRVIGVQDNLALRLLGNNGQQTLIQLRGLRPAQDAGWYRAGQKRLQSLLMGRYVLVDTSGWADNGRQLGRVSYGGQDVALGLLKQGLARHFANNQPADEATAYARAELAARQARLGLWSAAPGQQDTPRYYYPYQTPPGIPSPLIKAPKFRPTKPAASQPSK